MRAAAMVAAIASCSLSGCSDNPDANVTVAVSDASPGMEVPALWSPAAVLVDADGTVLVAERGSRQVRRISSDGSTEIVADIRSGSGALFETQRFGQGFGQELFYFQNHLLLASTGEPLALLDVERQTFEYVGTGSAAPEQDGALGDTDLAGLRGVTIDPSGTLFLAIENQIWRAQPAGNASPADALRQASLSLIAGNGQRGVGDMAVDATTAPLLLSDWVAMMADANGVYFTENPQLRYVRDGRMITLTGAGTIKGQADIPLRDYAASFIGRPHGLMFEGAPHVASEGVIKRFDIDSVDMNTGQVEGVVRPAALNALPEIGGFGFLDADHPVAAAPRSGALIVWDNTTGEFVSWIGPLSSRERYDLSNPDNPYRLRALLLPQAVSGIAAGEIILANSNLSRLITVSDRTRSPATTDTFWTQGNIDLGITTFATDNRLLFYGQDGGFLTRVRFEEGASGVVSEAIPRFFSRPRALGIPGPGDDVALVEDFDIVVTQTQAVLHFPDHAAIATAELETRRTDWETEARNGVIPLLDSALLAGTSLQGLRAWTATEVERWVVLPRRDDTDGVVIARGDLEAKRYVVMAGGGDALLTDGGDALSTSIDDVVGIDLVGDDVWLAAQDSGPPSLVRLTADSTLAIPVSACGQLPAGTHWLRVLMDPDTQQPGGWLVSARQGAVQTLYACAEPTADGLFVGDQQLDENLWTPLLDVAARPALSDDRSTLLLLHKERGVPSLTRLPLSWGAPAAAGVRHDLPLPLDVRLVAIGASADGNQAYVGIDDGEHRLLRMTLPPLAGPPIPPTSEPFVGGGSAVASGLHFTETPYGTQAVAMAVAQDGDLFLAMADTGVLWHIEAGDNGLIDDQESDIAIPLSVGPPMFRETASPLVLAVDPASQVYVGRGEAIYTIEDGETRRALGGGSRRGRAGDDVDDISISTVRGLTWSEDVLVVLTDDQLFTIRDGRVASVLANDGVLRLDDGSQRRLGFETVTQPIMSAGRPGEVLIAYPGQHEVLSVELP